ncbi:MAG: hypothetical protein MUC59_11315, partial [Saprospiraceae bacterium]|nr:hypothetical protein [Saprospiraceae bacterium]
VKTVKWQNLVHTVLAHFRGPTQGEIYPQNRFNVEDSFLSDINSVFFHPAPKSPRLDVKLVVKVFSAFHSH